MSLEKALAERVRSLARAKARLEAIDDQTAGHVVHDADADAVLKQALAILQSSDGHDAAVRVMRGEEEVAAHDALAGAGLVVWDPVSNTIRPTALLVELMKGVDR